MMAEEAWLGGKLEGYPDVLMPAAHALVQAARDLEQCASGLSREELLTKPNGAASVAFHLQHIAGSTDRLLTYAKGESLTEKQFEFLRAETAETTDLSAAELVAEATAEIEKVLAFCRTVPAEILFAERFVGRKRLPTSVFGLLFHIAEHNARHVGQIISTAKIVRK